jgi:carbon-monoxide dehydrogenase medium subunit
MLRRFEMHRARTVDEAVALREKYGDDAALYAGGTELLLAMKLGVARWRHLIDIKPIAELRRISASQTHVRIGATATHWDLERDPTIARLLPTFARLERDVANVRVRAAGTLGGNIAFAEPHADPPALLNALGASVLLRGASGARSVPIADFVTGMYQTVLAADEIMVAIEVPIPAASSRQAYAKFQILERPSVGIAIAADLRDGRFASAPTVVVGAVDEMPKRAATSALRGAALADAATADALAEAARRAVEPVADLAGDADYKRHLVGVFARRALDQLSAAA